MPKYRVDLSITVEANNEQEAHHYISNQLLMEPWNEAKIVDIQREFSADDNGLNGEINLDNIILSDIHENTYDVERFWQTWKKVYEDYLKEEINLVKGELIISTQELRQIFKDRLANAEDEYQHYTMVDKDDALAFYAREDLNLYKAVLALIDKLEKEGITNV